MSAPVTADVREMARWSVAAVFLEALGRGDFRTMHACLDPAVHFRALVPRGLIEHVSSDETIVQLREWFGAHDTVEMIDASIGQVGARAYLRWRIRRGHAGDPDSFHIVEQHLFATVTDRIERLDLLSSGFHAEGATT